MVGLHWLPVEYRIQFKILLFVYKSLTGLAPNYLSDLLSHYHTIRPLGHLTLCCLFPRHLSCGITCLFTCVQPLLFKFQIISKTFLFKRLMGWSNCLYTVLPCVYLYYLCYFFLFLVLCYGFWLNSTFSCSTLVGSVVFKCAI